MMEEGKKSMSNLFNLGWIDVIGVSAGTVMTVLLGSWLPLMTTVLILQGVDIISGILAASKAQEGEKISSKRFTEGLAKKGGMWLLVILAHSLDTLAFGSTPAIEVAVLGFLLANEGISIIENLGALGVPIPSFIGKYLEKLRDTNASGPNSEPS